MSTMAATVMEKNRGRTHRQTLVRIEIPIYSNVVHVSIMCKSGTLLQQTYTAAVSVVFSTALLSFHPNKCTCIVWVCIMIWNMNIFARYQSIFKFLFLSCCHHWYLRVQHIKFWCNSTANNKQVHNTAHYRTGYLTLVSELVCIHRYLNNCHTERMSTGNHGKPRPKSSLPKMQARSPSEESLKTSTFPRLRMKSGSDYNESTKSLKEVTSIPGVVKVCGGTYITNSRQSIGNSTKLFLHEKFQRRVLQVRCQYPPNIINIPLSSGIQIGFEHHNTDYSSTREVMKDKKIPKVLAVKKTCQCNTHPLMADSDVLTVLTITDSKELLVRKLMFQNQKY